MKNKLVRLVVLMVPLVAFTLGGCAEGPATGHGDLNSPETAGEPVVLLDPDLGDTVAVDLVRTGPNDAGLLTVQANIRNRTGHDVEIQVQTLFYDANGMVLNSEPGNEAAWTSLVVTANQTIPYRSQSLVRKANHFTVRIRFLHRPS